MKYQVKFFFVYFLIFSLPLFSSLEKKSDISFGTFAFSHSRAFFLGARNVGAQKNAVSFAKLVQEEDELPELQIEEFSIEKVFINADEKTREKDDEGKGTNPVYDKSIFLLSTLEGTQAIVVTSEDSLGTKQQINLLQTSDTVVTTTEKIRDAAGADGSGVSAIAGARSHIFAAVNPSGGVFGGDNSGLSLVATGSNQLITIDATTGKKGGNKSVDFDKTADALMAITADCSMANVIDMQWDSSLNRLFIALRLQRADSSGIGGCIALLVARIDGRTDKKNPNKIIIEPIATLDASNFTTDSTGHIFGFFKSADSIDTFATVHKTRVLSTSTAKKYLVINSDISTGNVKNKIFAVPLIEPTYEKVIETEIVDGKTVEKEITRVANEESVGKIADKGNFLNRASSAANMTLATDAAALVGGGDAPNDATVDIEVFFVSGDSVIIGLSGSTANKSGFFKSTALFDSQGKISKWTPWQRVMGRTDVILGGGFDPNPENLISNSTNSLYMYLTNDSSGNPNTVKATQWGKDPSGDFGLGELIEVQFPIDQGGTFSLFDFDEQTPSFKAGDDNLGLMVATGYKKIMLIETGTQVAGGVFTPNRGDFTTGALLSTDGSASAGVAGSKTMIVSGGVLDDLGPIDTADVSRVDAAAGAGSRGYLFVGGRNGVAVLSEANGDGWDTTAGVGLKRGFVGITSTMSFKQLGSFSNVRKVVCDDEYVYVLTTNALHRMSLAIAANFSAVGATSPTFITIASSSVVTGNANSTFYDVLISSKIALLATREGLFRIGDVRSVKTVTSATDANWTEVLISIGSDSVSLGIVTQLDLMSAVKGTFFQGGELYVLVSDPAYNLASVFRFVLADTRTATVSGVSIVPVKEANDIVYFMALGRHRLFFRSDGVTVFHQSPQNFGSFDILHFVGVRENISINTLRGFPIDLDIEEGVNKNIGLIVRNSASGAWMIPGDFGLRVND